MNILEVVDKDNNVVISLYVFNELLMINYNNGTHVLGKEHFDNFVYLSASIFMPEMYAMPLDIMEYFNLDTELLTIRTSDTQIASDEVMKLFQEIYPSDIDIYNTFSFIIPLSTMWLYKDFYNHYKDTFVLGMTHVILCNIQFESAHIVLYYPFLISLTITKDTIIKYSMITTYKQEYGNLILNITNNNYDPLMSSYLKSFINAYQDIHATKLTVNNIHLYKPKLLTYDEYYRKLDTILVNIVSKTNKSTTLSWDTTMIKYIQDVHNNI